MDENFNNPYFNNYNNIFPKKISENNLNLEKNFSDLITNKLISESKQNHSFINNNNTNFNFTNLNNDNQNQPDDFIFKGYSSFFRLNSNNVNINDDEFPLL